MSTQMMNQQIAEYFKTQPVVKAWIFGSYSRNEQRPWVPGGYPEVCPKRRADCQWYYLRAVRG